MRFASLALAGVCLAACTAPATDAPTSPDSDPGYTPPPSDAGPAPQPEPEPQSEPEPDQASDDWRDYALPADVERIEDLDAAWEAGLGAAPPDEVERYAPVLDPGAALDRPQPAPGDYQCRTFKLGGLSGFIAYDWFKCRVELTPGGDLTVKKLTGSQRQEGKLYPREDDQLVFLGSVAWGTQGEAAPGYGENPERDQVGVFERIGENRYRLVLPWPRQESELDVIEFRR